MLSEMRLVRIAAAVLLTASVVACGESTGEQLSETSLAFSIGVVNTDPSEGEQCPMVGARKATVYVAASDPSSASIDVDADGSIDGVRDQDRLYFKWGGSWYWVDLGSYTYRSFFVYSTISGELSPLQSDPPLNPESDLETLLPGISLAQVEDEDGNVRFERTDVETFNAFGMPAPSTVQANVSIGEIYIPDSTIIEKVSVRADIRSMLPSLTQFDERCTGIPPTDDVILECLVDRSIELGVDVVSDFGDLMADLTCPI